MLNFENTDKRATHRSLHFNVLEVTEGVGINFSPAVDTLLTKDVKGLMP
jgi:hypothetical protein